MNDNLINIITMAMAEATKIVIVMNGVAYLGSKVMLRNHSRTNGVVKEFCAVDPRTVEERKKAVPKEKMNQLKEYVEKLANYTEEENLKTVYRNLKTVKIKRNPLLLMHGSTGSVDVKKNCLMYQLKSAIGHEFLHLASSYYDPKEKEYQVGFCQRKNFSIIGKGLNEGYTELLASRIYNKNNRVEAYKRYVELTKLFEYFFDDPKEMEKYYFNHNLPGFIHRMEQYIPRKELIGIIKGMDKMLVHSSIAISPFPTYEYLKVQMKLYYWFNAKNPSPVKRKEFEEIIKKTPIGSFLLKKQKIKLHKEFQKGTPVFSKNKKVNPPYQEVKKQNSPLPMRLENQRKVLEELLPYQGVTFQKLCSEVFQTPENQINILHATKLYCMMTGIEFPTDRKVLNSYCRQVQSLILPENEKKYLDYRVERQLKKKIDIAWQEYYSKNEWTESSMRRKGV